MIGLQVQYNPANRKFLVKRVNVPQGSKDADNTFYIRTPEDTDKLPQGILVTAYNRTHADHNHIQRFRTLTQAREEGYEALRIMGSSAEQTTEATAATTEKPKRTRNKKQGEEGAEAQPRGPRLTQIAPKPADQLKAARQGTKIANMIDLLAKGIFADDLKQQLQRKGRALSGRINRVHGYGVHSEVKDGKVFYTLVLPEGVNQPLAHTVPEEKPAKPAKAEGAEGASAEGGEAKPKRTRKPKGEAATAGSAAEGDGAAAVGAQS